MKGVALVIPLLLGMADAQIDCSGETCGAVRKGGQAGGRERTVDWRHVRGGARVGVAVNAPPRAHDLIPCARCVRVRWRVGRDKFALKIPASAHPGIRRRRSKMVTHTRGASLASWIWVLLDLPRHRSDRFSRAGCVC